jgi:hypothetical protein
MFLKKYQQKVVTESKSFYSKARETKDAFDTARKSLPENMRHTLIGFKQPFRIPIRNIKTAVQMTK